MLLSFSTVFALLQFVQVVYNEFCDYDVCLLQQYTHELVISLWVCCNGRADLSAG